MDTRVSKLRSKLIHVHTTRHQTHNLFPSYSSRHGGEASGAAWTPSGYCSPTECSRPRAACPRRSVSAGQAESPPSPRSGVRTSDGKCVRARCVLCLVSCVLCLVGGGWVGGSNFGGINAYAGAGERELTLLFTLSIVSKNPTSRVTVFPVSSLTKICPCGCPNLQIGGASQIEAFTIQGHGPSVHV